RDRDAVADAGRAGARQPGPALRQRARGGARAVARDRSEAAQRRARVRRCADRPRVRVGALEARRALPLRPHHRRARARPRASAGLDGRADGRVDGGQQLQPDARRDGALAAGVLLTIEAVVFDVDFTLAKPGPDLGPEGYERLGARFGLELDPS